MQWRLTGYAACKQVGSDCFSSRWYLLTVPDGADKRLVVHGDEARSSPHASSAHMCPYEVYMRFTGSSVPAMGYGRRKNRSPRFSKSRAIRDLCFSAWEWVRIQLYRPCLLPEFCLSSFCFFSSFSFVCPVLTNLKVTCHVTHEWEDFDVWLDGLYFALTRPSPLTQC